MSLGRTSAVSSWGSGGSPIIGINDYAHPRVPKLRYAVNDARSVEGALLAHGFRRDRIITPLGPAKVVRADDGAEMVLVPAGELLMGSNDGDAAEKPPHRVHLDAFLHRQVRDDRANRGP